MARPALKRLLCDIETGKVDVIVVYKIDRLTRSLADFARMIEIFDRRRVSFVSVTQAFNTTTSMGRLTLNVLLSFAQFEREVTGKRIRDKIAASKAKGMWMGGIVPLGYEPPASGARALAVNQEEAEIVRTIFGAYIDLSSVHALQRWLEDRGIRSKRRVTRAGRLSGGRPFSRGALFQLLRNRVYRGMIVHKGRAHPGRHQAIIDGDLFAAVQARLDANTRRRASNREQKANAPLAGRLFDAAGRPMSPTFSYGRGGRLYRYYVSAPLQQGARRDPPDTAIRRIFAPPLEVALATVLRRLIAGCPDDPLTLVVRAELHDQSLHCLLPIDRIVAMRQRLEPHERLEPDPADARLARLHLPLVRRRGETWVLKGQSPGHMPDPVLVRALRSAHAMLHHDDGGLPKTGKRKHLASVMDFACGSGSLLLNVRKRMGPHGIGKIYGQEKNITTYNLARMNMLLHGVKDSEFEIYHGDTLTNDWDLLRETNPAKKPHFDAVVANPPFSYRWDPNEALGEDVRFKNYGLAPKSAADFAFLLHGFHYLKDDGVMAIILPHGVLFRGSAEAKIRRKLLDDGHIDTVIGLPANLFYSTGIPVCILVLKKCKKPDDVLFINASEHFEKGKRQNYLSDEHIEKIVDTYQQRPESIERYARRVEMGEIEANNCNLNISRYVSTAEQEVAIDLSVTHKESCLSLKVIRR